MAGFYIPKFSGEDPSTWLEKVDAIWYEFQLSDAKILELVFPCLVGKAKTWIESNMSLIFGKDWCAFSYLLLWEFDSTIEIRKAEEFEVVEASMELEEDESPVENSDSFAAEIVETQLAITPTTRFSKESKSVESKWDFSDSHTDSILVIPTATSFHTPSAKVLLESIVSRYKPFYNTQLFAEMPDKVFKVLLFYTWRDGNFLYADEMFISKVLNSLIAKNLDSMIRYLYDVIKWVLVCGNTITLKTTTQAPVYDDKSHNNATRVCRQILFFILDHTLQRNSISGLVWYPLQVGHFRDSKVMSAAVGAIDFEHCYILCIYAYCQCHRGQIQQLFYQLCPPEIGSLNCLLILQAMGYAYMEKLLSVSVVAHIAVDPVCHCYNKLISTHRCLCLQGMQTVCYTSRFEQLNTMFKENATDVFGTCVVVDGQIQIFLVELCCTVSNTDIDTQSLQVLYCIDQVPHSMQVTWFYYVIGLNFQVWYNFTGLKHTNFSTLDEYILCAFCYTLGLTKILSSICICQGIWGIVHRFGCDSNMDTLLWKGTIQGRYLCHLHNAIAQPCTTMIRIPGEHINLEAKVLNYLFKPRRLHIVVFVSADDCDIPSGIHIIKLQLSAVSFVNGIGFDVFLKIQIEFELFPCVHHQCTVSYNVCSEYISLWIAATHPKYSGPLHCSYIGIVRMVEIEYTLWQFAYDSARISFIKLTHRALRRIIFNSQGQQFKSSIQLRGAYICNTQADDLCIKTFVLSISRPTTQAHFYMSAASGNLSCIEILTYNRKNLGTMMIFILLQFASIPSKSRMEIQAVAITPSLGDRDCRTRMCFCITGSVLIYCGNARAGGAYWFECFTSIGCSASHNGMVLARTWFYHCGPCITYIHNKHYMWLLQHKSTVKNLFSGSAEQLQCVQWYHGLHRSRSCLWDKETPNCVFDEWSIVKIPIGLALCYWSVRTISWLNSMSLSPNAGDNYLGRSYNELYLMLFIRRGGHATDLNSNTVIRISLLLHDYAVGRWVLVSRGARYYFVGVTTPIISELLALSKAGMRCILCFDPGLTFIYVGARLNMQVGQGLRATLGSKVCIIATDLINIPSDRIPTRTGVYLNYGCYTRMTGLRCHCIIISLKNKKILSYVMLVETTACFRALLGYIAWTAIVYGILPEVVASLLLASAENLYCHIVWVVSMVVRITTLSVLLGWCSMVVSYSITFVVLLGRITSGWNKWGVCHQLSARCSVHGEISVRLLKPAQLDALVGVSLSICVSINLLVTSADFCVLLFQLGEYTMINVLTMETRLLRCLWICFGADLVINLLGCPIQVIPHCWQDHIWHISLRHVMLNGLLKVTLQQVCAWCLFLYTLIYGKSVPTFTLMDVKVKQPVPCYCIDNEVNFCATSMIDRVVRLYQKSWATFFSTVYGSKEICVPFLLCVYVRSATCKQQPGKQKPVTSSTKLQHAHFCIQQQLAHFSYDGNAAVGRHIPTQPNQVLSDPIYQDRTTNSFRPYTICHHTNTSTTYPHQLSYRQMAIVLTSLSRHTNKVMSDVPFTSNSDRYIKCHLTPTQRSCSIKTETQRHYPRPTLTAAFYKFIHNSQTCNYIHPPTPSDIRTVTTKGRLHSGYASNNRWRSYLAQYTMRTWCPLRKGDCYTSYHGLGAGVT